MSLPAPGSTMAWQLAVNAKWNESLVSGKIKKFNPVKARLKYYCIACAKRGSKVYLDHSVSKERWNYSTYEIDVWTCPLCKKAVKDYQKVKGKGKGRSGIDSF